LLRDEPLMVLALARPEVREHFPALWSERGLTEICLKELSRKACERLGRDTLGDEVKGETVGGLGGRSGGNAVFLPRPVRARAEARQDVPGTVLAMMQSRLDALEPEARRVLRAGSVLGEVFWRGAVEALVGGGATLPSLDGWVEKLEQRELVSRRPNAAFQG